MIDMSELLFDGPEDSPHRFVFTHGAGGPMRSPFMNTIAQGLAAQGIRVARFEFPYMQAGRKVPDKEPVLRETWTSIVESLGGGKKLVIGGKSLGGRIASMVADQVQARGLVCLGYPFHPPGKPERLRTAHLATLATPALIVQGTADPFGSPQDVTGYTLSPAIRIAWIEGGDHSLKPRRSTGRSAEKVEEVVRLVAEFVHRLH